MVHLGTQNAVLQLAVNVRNVRTFLSIHVLNGAKAPLETAIGPRFVVGMDARIPVLINVFAPRGVRILPTPTNAVGMAAPFVMNALRENEGL